MHDSGTCKAKVVFSGFNIVVDQPPDNFTQRDKSSVCYKKQTIVDSKEFEENFVAFLFCKISNYTRHADSILSALPNFVETKYFHQQNCKMKFFYIINTTFGNLKED